MENLLRNDYTVHYGLPVCKKPNLVIQTIEVYFEIEDTIAKEIILHITKGNGEARFSNPNASKISIANYDKFVTSLPNSFQRGKGRCDIIVSDTNKYFILGEIKDSPDIKHHRKQAKKQLIESLTTLIAVPEIQKLVSNRTIKRCCYFNKKSNSPEIIMATVAFNRLSTIFQDGFKMSNPAIEKLNFEFWEYLGEQTFSLL